MTEDRKNKIHFFSEKKWIMAYWFKTRRKTEFTEKYLMEQWCKWWGNDFSDCSDERLHDVAAWIKETVRTMTKDEIKKKRRNIADNRPVPRYIKELAERKGYYVKKCSTRNHPLKVSGYAVYVNPKAKNAVYGKKFNLTIQHVKEYLETKEDK